jgi:deoxyribose-phosphate aldolase
MFTTVEQIAGILDLALLDPRLTNVQVVEQLELAKRHRIACAIVRPCDIDLAVRTLAGSSVRPGSVAGFPHGSQNTAAKLYELRDLLRRGAREIHMVIAVPKLLSREFQQVQTELDQAADACRREETVLKVIFENAYLTDELKIVACRSCARAGVDFASTSTGFAPSGYMAEDLQLMRRHLPDEIGLEAAGGLNTLDQVFEASAAGAGRIATSAAVAVLDEWKARLAAPPA